MGRQGYSQKPCHGCGSTEPHPTGELCFDCRNKMKLGEEYMKFIDKLKANNEFECVEIPASNQSIRFGSKRHVMPAFYYHKKISKLIFELINHCSIKDNINYQHDSSLYELISDKVLSAQEHFRKPKRRVVISKNIVETIIKLVNTIQEEFTKRENAAFRKGKSIVKQLMSGGISFNEFEEKE